MTPANATVSGRPARREKVAHIRFAPEELAAIASAAETAGLSVSAFVRSLACEGAGLRPFLNEEDQAILQLLAKDLRAVGNALNQAIRALNTGRMAAASNVAAAADDARAIALTVAAELSQMTKSASSARRLGAR
ncbi:plasmid mobilization relaxosome protein MobC [Mesorhizobium sp. ESP-6-2]|uniref:plasmid mobilization protein n=2 Tax=unclassified Mesorhizobium TaxID=325217 RepID=UPI00112D70A3|nr:plasmid mobilization relaxosome protein MobC [Mesorhizobium sp. B2-2-2]MBZ9811191.1 plasmid mobilization relaxosome protein MobC [Mesorhizobium sp. ESP-6-2]TPM25771.1 plasmid mobilization relaxosome protein MobC [Mesorhizobium sp. B2-2-2]